MSVISQIKNKRGFTILELLVSMTLFAMIVTSILVAVENLSIARLKTLNRVALLEELYFFSEQLFSSIKDGGTLDYEEYWNRNAVGTVTQSGHYTAPTGVGNYGKWWVPLTVNYGSGIYLCRSNNGASMGTGWCLENYNNSASGSAPNGHSSFSGTYQRYGQYLAQFTDYNSNYDNDGWDENGDGNIIWDDDDRSIGDVPGVLTGSMAELYLINKNAKTRIFFRWNIKQDPNNTAVTCAITTTATGKILTNTGCVGNIQALRLRWLDIWLDHTGSTTDTTSYDGIVDTWVCTELGKCNWPALLTLERIATGDNTEWVDIFPSTINVKDLSFKIYPIKDPWMSWAAPDCSVSSCISPFIHPYVRMNLEMWFSWGKRRMLKNEDPTISISTSVSLSDFE